VPKEIPSKELFEKYSNAEKNAKGLEEMLKNIQTEREFIELECLETNDAII
jgi:hypothetical protein